MIGSWLVGGTLATVVLTTMMQAAAEMGITRMDLPFLLGTAVTDRRRRARAVGYLLHFGLGLAFALAYVSAFATIGWSRWWLGALFGVVHAFFVATVLVNVLLPIVHPRMGTRETAADETALLEPPGFLMLNYGRGSVLVNLAAHVAYGAILGWAWRS